MGHHKIIETHDIGMFAGYCSDGGGMQRRHVDLAGGG